MTTPRNLIEEAASAEAHVSQARSGLRSASSAVHADFDRNAPWLVPLLGVASGLLLARAPPHWHNHLLRHGLPAIGGGVFSWVTPFLRR